MARGFDALYSSLCWLFQCLIVEFYLVDRGVYSNGDQIVIENPCKASIIRFKAEERDDLRVRVEGNSLQS